jgi:hypothetical protein
MKSRTSLCMVAITLFAALAIRVRLVAQGERQAAPQDAVVNLDILGEPGSSTQQNDRLVSENATATGLFADTTAATAAPRATLSPTSLLSQLRQ